MKKEEKSSSAVPSQSVQFSRYPEELKKQAIELFKGSVAEYGAKQTAAKRVAELLGVRCFDTVLAWVRQSEIDGGGRQGVTSLEAEELRRLRRKVAELERANAILKAASVFFAAELDRPSNK